MTDSSSTQPSQKLNKSGEPLPDIGMKWGKSASKEEVDSEDISTTASLSKDKADKPDWENFYSEEEKAKLRAKGINPALKAEMEASQRKAEGKGIWSKVAQTAMGGGWIK